MISPVSTPFYSGAMNMTGEAEPKTGSSVINVQNPSFKEPPGVIIALPERGISHMRENLLMMGLGCEKYARLHVKS